MSRPGSQARARMVAGDALRFKRRVYDAIGLAFIVGASAGGALGTVAFRHTAPWLVPACVVLGVGLCIVLVCAEGYRVAEAGGWDRVR